MQKQLASSTRVPFAGSAALVFVLSGWTWPPPATDTATGAEPITQTSSKDAATKDTKVTVDDHPRTDGLRVYRDPETGKLSAQPSAAQRAALRAAIARHSTNAGAADPQADPQADQRSVPPRANESGEGLRSFPVPGGVGVFLDGRFQSSLVVRFQADGSWVIECTDDAVDQPSVEQPSAPALAIR